MAGTLRLGHRNEQGYVYVDDVTLLPAAPSVTGGLVNVANWVWDVPSLSWVKETQPLPFARTLLFAVIDTAVSGDNTIVAADATRKIKVVSYVVVGDAALLVRWKSGATNLSGAMSLAANGGVATAAPGTWLFETAVNANLILNLSAAIGARGPLAYFLDI